MSRADVEDDSASPVTVAFPIEPADGWIEAQWGRFGDLGGNTQPRWDVLCRWRM